MGKVTAIVSAYYAEDFIEDHMHRLVNNKEIDQIVVVCQVESPEEKIVWRFGFPNIIMIHTLDIPTIYAAWNKAIKEADGDYLISANCDDIIYEGSVRDMSGVLDSLDAVSMVWGECDLQPEGHEPRQWKRWDGKRRLIDGCFIGPMPMWRRSMHDKYGMFDESLHVAGDYEFWLRMAAGGEEFAYLDESVGIYTARPDSAEHRNSTLAADERDYVQMLYRGKSK